MLPKWPDQLFYQRGGLGIGTLRTPHFSQRPGIGTSTDLRGTGLGTGIETGILDTPPDSEVELEIGGKSKATPVAFFFYVLVPLLQHEKHNTRITEYTCHNGRLRRPER